MKLCRFQTAPGKHARVGLTLDEKTLLDLGAASVKRMKPWVLLDYLA